MNLPSEMNSVPDAYSQRILPFLRRYNVPESVRVRPREREVFRKFDLQGLDFVIAVLHPLQGALEIHRLGRPAGDRPGQRQERSAQRNIQFIHH